MLFIISSTIPHIHQFPQIALLIHILRQTVRHKVHKCRRKSTLQIMGFHSVLSTLLLLQQRINKRRISFSQFKEKCAKRPNITIQRIFFMRFRRYGSMVIFIIPIITRIRFRGAPFKGKELHNSLLSNEETVCCEDLSHHPQAYLSLLESFHAHTRMKSQASSRSQLAVTPLRLSGFGFSYNGKWNHMDMIPKQPRSNEFIPSNLPKHHPHQQSYHSIPIRMEMRLPSILPIVLPDSVQESTDALK